MHYVALFMTYTSTRACGYDKVFLDFLALGEGEKFGAEGHLEYIEFVLSVFKKSMSNVAAINGDNASVSIRITYPPY